jgi:hypothetical protein
VAVGFIFINIPGPIYYGENRYENEFNESANFEFTVLDSSWYANEVEIICSYEQSYGELVYCYFSFYQNESEINSITLTIIAKQGPRRVFSDSEVIELEPGYYNVEFSYECTELELRWIDVHMTQIRVDGRNDEQKIWDSFKIIILITIIVISVIVYKRESPLSK